MTLNPALGDQYNLALVLARIADLESLVGTLGAASNVAGPSMTYPGGGTEPVAPPATSGGDGAAGYYVTADPANPAVLLHHFDTDDGSPVISTPVGAYAQLGEDGATVYYTVTT